jgi:HAMP domain-containing protein
MRIRSLAAKFNLVFLAVSTLGFCAAVVITNHLLVRNAREETLQNARLLVQASDAAGMYTAAHIVPLLDNRLKFEFVPEAVPTFAAIEHLNQLLKAYPDYTYKQATLNPTNPRNRANAWETPLVMALRADPAKKELVGERATPAGPALYLARPIRITDAACLACHSTPDAAPRTMTDIYGTLHGFGWKMNETVGAMVVSVPMAVPLQRATTLLHTYMWSLLGVFAFLFVALNAMVHLFVTRRISRLTRTADQVSLGHFDAAAFDTRDGDELAQLGQSFDRMRTSLASAMKMLEEPQPDE